MRGRKMPKSIWIPEESGREGIQVTYTKSRDVLNISGWYDTFVGIEGKEIPFTEFCRQLGIVLKGRKEDEKQS